jgi:hypothetical protein
VYYYKFAHRTEDPKMLKSITVAALAVSCVSAFQAPSAFLGNGLKAQVNFV